MSEVPIPSRRSLYEFVRGTLAERGGGCTRAELLAMIQAHPEAAQRLGVQHRTDERRRVRLPPL